MAPNTLESDIFLNKTNLLIAQKQRLVASWLPSKRKAEELQHTKSKEEMESEEQEIFNTPVPELFGIGAKLPKDGEVRRQELSSNDKLRKQLLGKDYAKKQKYGTKYTEKYESGPLHLGSKPKPSPTPTKRAADDDSEDDRGRSSLGKTVKTNCARPESVFTENAMGKTKQVEENSSKAETQPLIKASNYLDEVLADRSLKQRKKSKKKKKQQVVADAAGNGS